MVARRTAGRMVAGALALLLAIAPLTLAFADETTTPPTEQVVATGVQVAGTDLGGMTAAQAADAIRQAVGAPTFAPIPVVAGGASFSLNTTGTVTLDVNDMVSSALAATSSAEIAPRYVVDAAKLKSFIEKVAARVYRKAVDAKRTIVKKRLKLTASKKGQKLGSTAALTAALARELADGSAQVTVTIPVSSVSPKTTSSNIGKTIVVVLSERHVYLYKGAKVEKKYRCAIGQRGHSTPTGTFKVIARSAHPVWRNPGSAWAKSMPAKIAAGPRNPLGLRALYLDASGIRIHGTANIRSIGTAASHGCVRLANQNIVDLYPRVKVGTPVYIVK